jgi:23S rRNA pseudouridine955/2504/2580 synthase
MNKEQTSQTKTPVNSKKVLFSELILSDEDYIIVNKPPFFSSLHDRTPTGKQNIISLAKEYCPTAQLCHRLDRETSGVLAIAKNPEAYRNLAIQFEKRKVRKVYHAIIEGIHAFDQQLVDMPILPLKTGSVKISHSEGKSAQTYFKTLDVYKYHTLVECRPITGRMHQIRIHLAVLKAPITGDLAYGGNDIFLSKIKKKFNIKKDEEERPLIQRLALHAQALSFEDLHEDMKTITCPYPKDFAALVKQLERYR